MIDVPNRAVLETNSSMEATSSLNLIKKFYVDISSIQQFLVI